MSDRVANLVRCASCGMGDVLQVTFELDGSLVRFFTCHACEAKWWERNGTRVSLGDVIDLIPSR